MKKRFASSVIATGIALAMTIGGTTAASAAAGNQSGDVTYADGTWWQYGVSSTVVWSNVNSWYLHRAGVQAGYSGVKWTPWTGSKLWAKISYPRVAYDNYQFMERQN